MILLFKSGNDLHISKYRPISILLTFSKILKKVVHKTMYHFLDARNIFYKRQYGFRKTHCTCMAIVDVIDQISMVIDEGKYIMGMFLDLSKVSNTNNHKILFDKLHRYGIQGIALTWIKNYLSSRTQQVAIRDATLDEDPLTCGVSQGSILGPLLFLYINDIFECSNIPMLILFSDDKSVFISGYDLKALTKVTNDELTILSKWYKVNKLSINLKKTNYFFSSIRKRSLPKSLKLQWMVKISKMSHLLNF